MSEDKNKLLSEMYKDDPRNQIDSRDIGSDPLPEKKRSFTDPLCLLLIIANWGLMTYVGFAALGYFEDPLFEINDGHPELLYRGVDHNGWTCGVTLTDQDTVDEFEASDYTESKSTVDSAWADLNYLYYPNPYGSNWVTSGPSKYSFVGVDYAICVASCPSDDSETITDYSTGDTWMTMSNSRFISWCLPDELVAAYEATLTEYTSVIMQLVMDIKEVYWIVLICGLIIPFFVAVGYIHMVRNPVTMHLIVWGSIVAVFVFIVGLGVGLGYLSYNLDDDQESQESLYKYSGIVLIAIGLLFAVAVCCLRKKIELAMGLIEEAAHACEDSLLVTLMIPLKQLLGLAVFGCVFTTYGLYLASGGDHDTSGTTPDFTSFSYNTTYGYLAVYMIFTMFWTIEFVHALGTIGFAAATTSWYFHPTDEDLAAVDVSVSFNDAPIKHPPKKLEGIKQIAADVREAMFKHAGTAAFGSCIIAVVETIETIVSYIQAKVEQTIKASGNTAVLLMARMILCCIRCFLWCIEKCLKFISKHAYIQTAIYGTSFMPSCYKAFFLIIRNAGLATCLTGIGSFVFIIGRSVVTLSAASVAFLWIDSAYGDDINSPLFPTVVVGIMAYVIASVFMGILEISSDTLLACYVLDKEMHDDNPEYARGALHAWVNKSVITNADGNQYNSINAS